MEKRLPLALFLSLLVLFAWSMCNPRPVDPGKATETGTAEAGDVATEPSEPDEPPLVPAIADEVERTETLLFGRDGDGERWRAVVSNRGGRLVALSVGGYYRRVGLSDAEKSDPDNWAQLLVPVETEGGELGSLLLKTSTSSESLAPADLDEVLWTMETLRAEDGSAEGVEFRYGPGTGVVFTKRLTRIPGTWRLNFEIAIENTGAGEGDKRIDFVLVPAGCVPAAVDGRLYQEPRAIAIGLDEDEGEYESEWESADSARNEDEPLDVPTPLVIAGAHNKYFAFLLRGESPDASESLAGARYRGVRDEEYLAENPEEPKAAWRYVAADVNLALRLPPPGETALFRYTIYAGPKDPDLLREDHGAQEQIVESDLESGWSLPGTATIGTFLLAFLRFLHGFIPNWGWCIIVMTICVRVVLFPLNRRSQTAMARYQSKMKRVQPKLDEIKKKFEGNPQKLREAQAKLMQEEGAFPPLGGCAPIFLQIPIFFGLFSALRTAFDLRHQPFHGWIDDLSQPDRLFEINLNLLFFEVEYLNLLPPLMVVLWILQQLGMPKPADEQAARMQKMMMFMPVVMGVFLYNYAAGLSLYMITQSTLGIVEQRVIKKLWPIDDKEVEKKKGKGCGPFSGMMENLAEKHRAEMKRIQSGQARQVGQKKKKKPRRH